MRKVIFAAALVAVPLPALAWGGTGHVYIGEVAARNFPAAIPAFLKTPLAIQQIGLMAMEPDVSRTAGQPHDDDSDPGHFLDVSDDGTIHGGPKLSALPPTRRDYDSALRAVGSDEYKMGFLPYNIMDGWQQLVKDFALLRMDIAGVKFAKDKTVRRRFTDARAVRQILTLRDLGVWAHYVGDASQPMHASVHYNGWGEGPNPEGFVITQGLHAKFETDFVNAHVTQQDVAAALRPYQACGCALQQRVQDYLIASEAQLVPTYRLEKQGAFDADTPQAKAFTVARIAEGAAMLRDLVTDAWTAAGTVTLGYKVKASVADLEAGKADPALVN
jgi:hypothetical protein